MQRSAIRHGELHPRAPERAPAVGDPARPAPPIDRVTAQDLVSLATDLGPAPMQVGAVLLLGDAADLDPGRVRAVIGERIRAVPRLRRRLVRPGPGRGRPFWADDPDVDLDHHVEVVACPAPGDERALLAVAAERIGTRLVADRPQWRLTVVTGIDGDRAALVITFHHVLADGIGGLAVLAHLVDGTAPPPPDTSAAILPTDRDLVVDAVRARLSALAGLPAAVRRLGSALAGLRPTALGRAERCSLNRPTGSQRRLAVVRADLGDLRRCAHRHGATVNDVVLTAVAGALGSLLLGRNETVERVTVSMPVATRREASATRLGNEVSVVPVSLPVGGDRAERLREVAARTRAAKSARPAASIAVLGPVFRALARVGLFRWFIDRQRLVHTFVTNLRGPDEQLRFMDRPVLEVVPVAQISGNVSTSFAVLSYHGVLAVAVLVDPVVCPDLDALEAALQAELDALAAPEPEPAAASEG